MANDDGQLLTACILGFGGGIYLFLKGFREFRKYRVVSDTPEIPIRSIPMGLVHVQGRARGDATLLSPITHTPCYVFMVVVEEWHTESEGGGEWKRVATDIQCVNFDLEDASGRVRVDANHAELDLPSSPVRKVRGPGSNISSGSSAQVPGAATASGTPATDAEVLQYVQQARVRHITQMVGKGIDLIIPGRDSAQAPQRPSFLSMLADPTGAAAAGFQGQFIKAMLARKDPRGEIPRLALEVWKHPQGTPEFESALVRCAQAYARAMAMTKQAPEASAVLAQIRKQPQLLGMVALVAGSADPQADPDDEKARQVALAFGREHPTGMARHQTAAPEGHFRLTESCLLPGQTYNITGTCTENLSPRDEHDRNIILKGTNEPTFLISSKSEKQVESGLRKRVAWMIFGGAALAIVCLAILLGKMGLL